MPGSGTVKNMLAGCCAVDQRGLEALLKAGSIDKGNARRNDSVEIKRKPPSGSPVSC